MEGIDLNDTVSVELTEYGADFLNEYNKKNCLQKEYKEGDIYKNQMWHLMHIFTESIRFDKPKPFNNLKFDKQL